MDPESLVIGHCGDSEDLAYLRELMDAGATIGMDRFGMEHVLPDENRVRTVLELLRLGYADRMVLSHDAAFFSRVTPPSWRARNAPHWHMENIPRRIVPMLLDGGATQEDLDRMLVEQPRPDPHPEDTVMTLRTSIATVCLSGTLEQKLHACAEAGFDGVEIFEPDLVASPASPEEIRALAERLGLTLDLYQPFRDAEGVDEALFPGVLHRARAKFRLMQRLGIDTMLVCSNVATATVDDDQVSASQLRRLGDAGRRARRPARLRGPGLGAVRRRLPTRLADRRSWPTTRRSACAWTASTSCPAGTTPPRSRRSPARRSSSSSSPTHPP